MVSMAWAAPLPLAIRAPNIEGCLAKFVAAAPTGPTDRARDRELLERVACGDVAALRAIYEQHASRAITIAYRILRNREEAEDVVQETFLEVWRRSAQFDPGRGGAVAWVVTIARSRAIDRLRARNIAGRTIATAADETMGLMPARRDIAAKTASPLGTVKMRVKLAMAKLAELLRDEKT